MATPDPDVQVSSDSANTLAVEPVDTTPAGYQPASNLPAIVEGQVELTDLAPTLTVDESGLSNY